MKERTWKKIVSEHIVSNTGRKERIRSGISEPAEITYQTKDDESRWGEIFRRPDRPWGPPSLLYNGYRVFPGIESGRGVTLTPHPLLLPKSKNRVELYLYSH